MRRIFMALSRLGDKFWVRWPLYALWVGFAFYPAFDDYAHSVSLQVTLPSAELIILILVGLVLCYFGLVFTSPMILTALLSIALVRYRSNSSDIVFVLKSAWVWTAVFFYPLTIIYEYIARWWMKKLEPEEETPPYRYLGHTDPEEDSLERGAERERQLAWMRRNGLIDTPDPLADYIRNFEKQEQNKVEAAATAARFEEENKKSKERARELAAKKKKNEADEAQAHADRWHYYGRHGEP